MDIRLNGTKKFLIKLWNKQKISKSITAKLNSEKDMADKIIKIC